MPTVENTLLSELLAWYSLQRHDFLNHWQVIMGYLQLNKGEKALAYMREALQGLDAEKKSGLIPQPAVAAILLGWTVRLRQNGINVRLNFPEELKKETFWLESWQEEYGEALYGYTKHCLELCTQQAEIQSGQEWAEISLYPEGDGLTCAFGFGRGDTVKVSEKRKFGD